MTLLSQPQVHFDTASLQLSVRVPQLGQDVVLGVSGCVDITSFGASPNASAATNTAAILAAWGICRSVFVPPGLFYVLPNLLLFTANGQEIFGAGPMSQLAITTPTGSVLACTAGLINLSAHHLQFVGPASGSTAGALFDTSGAVVNECDFHHLSAIGGYDGFALGVTAHSYFRQSYASGPAHRGIRLVAGAGGRGELQWEMADVLGQWTGDDGIAVEAGGSAPGVTLGAWSNVSGFGSTGHAVALYGSASCPVHDLDWTGGTAGSSGKSAFFADTYGKNNRVEGVLFERAGMDLTGPGGATAASGVGEGVEISRNNMGLDLVNCHRDNNSFDGIATSGSGVSVVGGRSSGNGLGSTASSQSRNNDVLHLAGSLILVGVTAFGQGVSAYLLVTYDGSKASVSTYQTIGHTVATNGVEALFYAYTNGSALKPTGGISIV